jgi:hypothetical protein
MDAHQTALFSFRTALADLEDAASTSRRLPADAVFSERLAEYLALRGSTTFFLQSVSGATVGVEVLHQHVENSQAKGDILHRLSRLHVRGAHNIVLVAESAVQLRFLDALQRQKLIGREEGIGKLLDPDNRGLIEKIDIDVKRIQAPTDLRTDLDWAVSRHFALNYNGIVCAEIREVVNNESLGRAR